MVGPATPLGPGPELLLSALGSLEDLTCTGRVPLRPLSTYLTLSSATQCVSIMAPSKSTMAQIRSVRSLYGLIVSLPHWVPWARPSTSLATLRVPPPA